jgi:HSP90 family molecular chaperone
MKEDQKDIYYLTGFTRQEVETSPLAEKLLKRGYEVCDWPWQRLFLLSSLLKAGQLFLRAIDRRGLSAALL